MASFMDKMGLGETGKLNGELKNLELQRQQIFAQIGQMVYKHKKEEGSEEPDFSKLIEAIDNVNANTKAIEDRISLLRGEAPCPKCGQFVPQGNRFCPHCGGEMPVIQMQPAPGAPGVPGVPGAAPQGGAFCAACGAPLQPGMKFCAKCGAPA